MPVPLFDWTDNGDGTWTWAITGTASADQVRDTALDAARYLYPSAIPSDLAEQYQDADRQWLPFDSLTLLKKKAIIGIACRRYFRECATAHRATDAANTARDAALKEADTAYDL